jgi:hypothetical protein
MARLRSPLVAVLAGGVLLLGVGFGSGFAVGRHHPPGGTGPAAVGGITTPDGTRFAGPPQGGFSPGQLPQDQLPQGQLPQGPSGTQGEAGTGLSSSQ